VIAMYTDYAIRFDSAGQFLDQVAQLLIDKRLDKFKPLAFSFYLEFDFKQDAEEASEILTSAGFSVVTEQEHESVKWLCWCHKSTTPTPLKLEEMANSIFSAVWAGNGDVLRWETNPYNSGQELGQLLAAFELQFSQDQIGVLA